jgi:hypothetical protein
MDRVQSLTSSNSHEHQSFHPDEAFAGAAAFEKVVLDHATKLARKEVSVSELIGFAAETTKLLTLAVRIPEAAQSVAEK